MKIYIILCTGFCQYPGRENGFDKIRRALEEYRSSDVDVRVLTWDADHVSIVSQIMRDLDHAPAAFVVAGYSYGGFLATKVCEEIGSYVLDDGTQYNVDDLILVDAVARPWVRLPMPIRKLIAPALRYLFTFTSIIPWNTINVPSCVGHVDVFRQRETLPKGHAVVATDATVREPTVWLETPHVEVDDNLQVKNTIIDRAREVISLWNGYH